MSSLEISTPKLTVVAAVVAALIALTALPAAAHDPIFITDDQTTPDTGPYMPDGTISWALYGVVLDSGDTRGFEFDLREGDELFISLLIPNLAPETDLADAELPIIELETPSGEIKTILPEIRDVFDEPFSNTSYVNLAELREPGEAGRYRGTVIGNAPSRFSVAIGEEEIFFTETERSGDRPGSFPEIAAPLNAWYSTAPGEEPAETGEGEAEIQMDLIDEAMESGEASLGTEQADESADQSADQSDGESADESAAGLDDSESDDGGGLGALALPIVVLAAGIGGFMVYRRRDAGDAVEESLSLD